MHMHEGDSRYLGDMTPEQYVEYCIHSAGDALGEFDRRECEDYINGAREMVRENINNEEHIFSIAQSLMKIKEGSSVVSEVATYLLDLLKSEDLPWSDHIINIYKKHPMYRAYALDDDELAEYYLRNIH
ncbi:MAG: hypothetical protein ABIH39_00870 [Candidatus Margulisiibacteriota bacterium]